MAVTKRGKPDRETVHFRNDSRYNRFQLKLSAQPLCGHGSYHVYWTDNWDEVTCEACIEAGKEKPCPGKMNT